MSRTPRWIRGPLLALCVTILCVAALGELAHDHRGCQFDSSLGCPVCAMTFLVVLASPALALLAPAASRRYGWAAFHLLIPSGAPLGRPTARGPPAR